MITDLFAILIVAFVAFFFWRQRQQSELVKIAITRRCEQVNVQLISIAREKGKLEKSREQWRWVTRYQFEFSVNGMNCYQGYAVMQGYRVQEIYMPPYPL